MTQTYATLTQRHPDYVAALDRCDGIGFVEALAARAGFPTGEIALRTFCALQGAEFIRDQWTGSVPGGVSTFLDWLKAKSIQTGS